MKQPLFYLAFLFSVLLVSCNNKNQLAPGEYHGQLPCADCSGINMELSLNTDKPTKRKVYILIEEMRLLRVKVLGKPKTIHLFSQKIKVNNNSFI